MDKPLRVVATGANVRKIKSSDKNAGA